MRIINEWSGRNAFATNNSTSKPVQYKESIKQPTWWPMIQAVFLVMLLCTS
jgi:hypothetical protein